MAADNALANLCLALVNDRQLWARFRDHPEQVIAEAKLSDEEKTLFTDGPVDQLRAHLGRSTASFSALIVSPIKR